MPGSRARGWLVAAAVATWAGVALPACSSSAKHAAVSGTTAVAVTTTTVPGPAASNTVVAKTGSGAFCQDVASSANSLAAVSRADSSPSVFKAQFQTAVQAFNRLVSEAPSEIKGPMVTLQQAVQKADSALAKVGYDITKVDPANPDFQALSGTQVQDANAQVSQYVKQRCGIDVNTPGTT